MEINRENYEIYFLDYHDGNLNPGQVAELLVFLEANPGFKEEFEAYDDILLVPDLTVSFSEKASLKKNNVPDSGIINLSNYENYFISQSEGLLSPKEVLLLEAFLKNHPELNADYELYQKVHVLPDNTITFPAKSKLRRSVLNTRRFLYSSLAAAASLALLFSIYIINGNKTETELMAVQESTTNKMSSNIRPKAQRKSQPENSITAADNNKKDIAFKNLTERTSTPTNIDSKANTTERVAVAEVRSVKCSGVVSRDLVEPKYAFIRQSKNCPAKYTQLFDQVKLADHMKNEPAFTPVSSSPKNVLRSGLEKLGSVFTGKEVPVDRNVINFWTIADLGISGYNLLTDKDLKLLTQSNDKGQVEAYALKGDEFEIERKLKKQ
jgi:hypothetical protein